MATYCEYGVTHNARSLWCTEQQNLANNHRTQWLIGRTSSLLAEALMMTTTQPNRLDLEPVC